VAFVGDMDRMFRAIDVKTGKVLWETRPGTSVQGFPLTFSIAGKQNVPSILDPDVHYPSYPSYGNALYVFALPDRK
jgi:alcohol dehydrogenase (cytochrome c)